MAPQKGGAITEDLGAAARLEDVRPVEGNRQAAREGLAPLSVPGRARPGVEALADGLPRLENNLFVGIAGGIGADANTPRHPQNFARAFPLSAL